MLYHEVTERCQSEGFDQKSKGRVIWREKLRSASEGELVEVTEKRQQVSRERNHKAKPRVDITARSDRVQDQTRGSGKLAR